MTSQVPVMTKHHPAVFDGSGIPIEAHPNLVVIVNYDRIDSAGERLPAIEYPRLRPLRYPLSNRPMEKKIATRFLSELKVGDDGHG